MFVSNNFENGEVIHAPSLQRLTEQPAAAQVLRSSFVCCEGGHLSRLGKRDVLHLPGLDIGGEQIHIGQTRWRQPNHLRVHQDHLIVQP